MIVKQTESIDCSTGEIKTVTREIIKKVKPDEFIQVYLEDMSGLMKIASKSEIQVLFWLWKFSSFASEAQLGNMVVVTKFVKSKISESTGMSDSNIRKVLSVLKSKSLLISTKELGRGSFYLNPQYFFKGPLKERANCYKQVVSYIINQE